MNSMAHVSDNMQSPARLIKNPMHDHPLELLDTTAIRSGTWRCNNCNLSKNDPLVYRCGNGCDYYMCLNCTQPHDHGRHQGHPLYLSDTRKVYPMYNGKWKCDACKRTFDAGLAYHCFYDQFDLCEGCFNGRDLAVHIHPLKPVDAAILYDDMPGWWACDCCKKNGTTLGSRFSWHCSQCEFDACENCLKEIRIPQHPHPVRLTDSMRIYADYAGSWVCDICNVEYGDSNPEPGRGRPYHCFNAGCEFDCCYTCIADHTEDGGHDIAGEFPRRVRQMPIQEREHNPPQETFDDVDDDMDIDDPDSEKCVICFSKRKSATIVHGSTGHVCCCLSCASRLKAENKKCPICRAKIDRVIRNLNSSENI